jgi:hypothetical protein
MNAFVIMPFSKEFDDIYNLGIKETAKATGVNAFRLDEQLFDEGMLDRIYKEIVDADFIIADLSNRNANVFYELGFAHALEKLCILITDDAESIPFDLKHKRHIVYGTSITHLKSALESNIEWAKKEIEGQKNNPFKVTLKTDGILTNSTELSDVTLDLKIDIENVSKTTIKNISAIYIYSQKPWKLTQDGNKLPTTQSDVKGFNHRYFIKPPIDTLMKGGWTQSEIKAQFIIATRWRGDEIKDSYTIGGKLLMKINTDKETFDFELIITQHVDELPF